MLIRTPTSRRRSRRRRQLSRRRRWITNPFSKTDKLRALDIHPCTEVLTFPHHPIIRARSLRGVLAAIEIGNC
jgi:hypothetical protein